MFKRGKIYYERFRFPDGSQKRICLKTEDLDLAEKMKAKITTDIFMDRHFGTKQLREKRNVREMMTQLLDLEDGDKADDTTKTYASLKKGICENFGDLMLDEVTPEIISTYRAKKRLTNIKESTINTKLSFFKRYWDKARTKYNWTDNNPFKDINTPRSLVERNRCLTDEERIKLIDGLSQSKYLWLRDYVLVACDTGLRRKNMCQMTWWKNVDLQQKTLHFTASEMKGKKPHSMIMTDQVFDILSERKKIFGGEGTVFLNSMGNPVNRGSLSTSYTKLLRKFGITDFHLHDMRHDFCSQLALNGAELYDIAGMAAHSNIQQTMRYVHLMPARKKKAVEILNNRPKPKLSGVS